jgi:hypothetical protein
LRRSTPRAASMRSEQAGQLQMSSTFQRNNDDADGDGDGIGD